MRRTHVAFVLDKSASMQTMQEQAVVMFNEQVAALLEADNDAGDFIISLLAFNDELEWIYKDKPAQDLQELMYSQFTPSGMTALHDAIGEAMSHLSQSEPNTETQVANALHGTNQDDIAFLMIIVTDGCENASKEFDSRQINELMDNKKERDDWTSVFCGTEDINPNVMSASLGVRGQSMSSGSFHRGAEGMARLSESLDTGTRGYTVSRASGVRAVSDYVDSDASDQSDTPVDEE